MKKFVEVLIIVSGLLTLVLALMGCEPRQPAQTPAEIQASQWRQINAEQARLAETSRKVICLRASAGDPYAMIVQLAYRLPCKSGE